MNFFKMILATGLVAGCAMNVAMAAEEVWCGYITPQGTDASFTTKGKVLQSAQQMCTQKNVSTKIAMVDSPFYKDMGNWAQTCKDAQDSLALRAKCNKYYAYLSEKQPKFDKKYVYPKDYQHNVSVEQFCDAGNTNPNNMTDYRHSDECACVAGFAGQNVGAVGPYSWLDTATLKAQAKDVLNNDFRDIKDINIEFGSFNGKNQYSNLSLASPRSSGSIPGGLTPAQCCVAVGGKVVENSQMNHGGVKGPSCQ